MRYYLILFFTFTFILHADIAAPQSLFKTENSVISISVFQNLLFASTDNGTVELFDLKKNRRLNTIKLQQIKDGFSDELVNPRVTGVNSIDGNRVLILSDDTEARKALFIYDKNGSRIEHIFSYKDRLNISRAYFLDKDKIILGTLGNEIKLYDINKKRFIYDVQPYWSMLTDLILNKDRTLAFVAAESGVIYIYDTSSGEKTKEFHLHTDLALSAAFANGVLMSGGADRKCSLVFTNSGEKYQINTNFLVYAVGLSPSGEIGACPLNEQNDILIFDTKTGKEKMILKGIDKDKKINGIIFLSENEIIISSNSKEILKWRIP